VLDGCFDDCRMQGVWDEGNDKIDFVNSCAQSFVVPSVEFDSSGVCKRLGQGLCCGERATSDSDMDASIGQDLYGRFADETCAQQQDLASLRHERIGGLYPKSVPHTSAHVFLMLIVSVVVLMTHKSS
jgi:hypothetical protein